MNCVKRGAGLESILPVNQEDRLINQVIRDDDPSLFRDVQAHVISLRMLERKGGAAEEEVAAKEVRPARRTAGP